jgi:hypothetical protein
MILMKGGEGNDRTDYTGHKEGRDPEGTEYLCEFVEGEHCKGISEGYRRVHGWCKFPDT